jgi:ferritin-like metal-binding protein YciE
MGFFSTDIETMDDLFVHTLRGMYYAEQQIVQSLSTMVEKATNSELKSAFEQHLAETQGHVRRIEEVFEMQGVERQTASCPAIDGILKEGDGITGEVDVDDEQILDAALIAAAQAVEHYEIARYSTLIAWAKDLGRTDCASVLHENLEEEKAAGEKLTKIAESEVSFQASA